MKACRQPIKSLATVLLGAICLFLLSSCGGGSEGTGTLTIQGKIANTSDQPLSGVLVTVVETGDFATTNNEGNFLLNTDVVEGDVVLAVESPQVNTTVVIEDVLTESSVVELEIKVDETSNQASISNVEVLAKIVGACDKFFENRRVIRQSNKAPDGILCTVKVWIKGDGKPQGNVPFVLERRRCDERHDWVPVGEGQTASGVHVGVGQLTFDFHDDREHCVYRILAPSNVKDTKPIEYQIHTFTKQNFDKR